MEIWAKGHTQEHECDKTLFAFSVLIIHETLGKLKKMVNFSVTNNNLPDGEWLLGLFLQHGFSFPSGFLPDYKTPPLAGLGGSVDQFIILLTQFLGIRFNLAARAVGCWDFFKPLALGTVNQPECQPGRGLRCELAISPQIPFITPEVRGETINVAFRLTFGTHVKYQEA